MTQQSPSAGTPEGEGTGGTPPAPGGTPPPPGETPPAPGDATPPLRDHSGQRAAEARGTGGFRPGPTRHSGWVAGGVTFAGILLVINGVMAVLQGIAAIAKDNVYAAVDDYLYRINLTGWGWLLVILGAVAAFAGWGVLTGARWARITGIILAGVSVVFQFMFLPYAPLWGIILIAIDLFVIWALAVYRPEGAGA